MSHACSILALVSDAFGAGVEVARPESNAADRPERCSGVGRPPYD